MFCYWSTYNPPPMFFLIFILKITGFFLPNSNFVEPFPNLIPNPTWGSYPVGPYLNLFPNPAGKMNVSLT